MPNYRRLYVPGGTYFFTANLLDRSSDLLTRRIEQLRAAYAVVQKRMPFETLAIVILPDHIHCIWRLPEGDHDFSARWRAFKSEFSRSLPRGDDAGPPVRSGERGIWQRRFWEHAIRDDEDFNHHVTYIHFNPVKHGHVTSPDDWPYSTWHRWKADAQADLPKTFDQDMPAGERS